MHPLPSLAEIESASGLVNSVVPPTPQYSWPSLNHRTGCEAWIKHENHTVIGAFKVRGAVNYFARLRKREPDVRNVIAATRGNFGQAVAFAARSHGLAAAIAVPHGNSQLKNAAMRALGAELIEEGDDFQAALQHAEKLAAERGWHFVPAYHRDLACGNAVSVLQFFRAAPPLHRLYVPIGMGSCICATMAARDALGLATEVVGVAVELAPGITESFAAGRVCSHPVSTRIADGMACSTPNAEALEHILQGVKRLVVVSDDEVEAAMRAYYSDTHNVVEGAGAAALAAVLTERALNAGQRIGIMLTGGNVDRSVFARVLTGG